MGHPKNKKNTQKKQKTGKASTSSSSNSGTPKGKHLAITNNKTTHGTTSSSSSVGPEKEQAIVQVAVKGKDPKGMVQEARISDVSFGSRTKSPHSGTMGGHSTAWVAHTDAVRRQLLGKTPAQARNEFANMLAELKKLEATKLKPKLASAHQKDYEDALEGFESFLSAANKDAVGLHFVQRAIIKYLKLVNFVPLATVAGAGTGGHSEGQHRGYLIPYERSESGLTPQLETSFWGMFAADTPPAFLTDIKSAVKKTVVWTAAMQMFLEAMKTAYPSAFNALINEAAVKGKLVDDYGLTKDEAAAIVAELKSLGIFTPAIVTAIPPSVADEFDAAVQFILSGKKIGDVRVGGRTPSPLGSSDGMGAHTVAWSAHVEAVRKQLVGKDLAAAKTTMDELLAEAMKSKALKATKYVLADHLAKLHGAYDDAKAAKAAIEEAAAGDNELGFHLLQAYVHQYLAFVNMIPLMTSAYGKRTGGGEPTALASLRLYESAKTKTLTADELRRNLLVLLAGDAVTGFVDARMGEAQPQKGDLSRRGAAVRYAKALEAYEAMKKRLDGELEESYEAHPPSKELLAFRDLMSADIADLEKDPLAWAWAVILADFLETISRAFPKAFKDSGLGDTNVLLNVLQGKNADGSNKKRPRDDEKDDAKHDDFPGHSAGAIAELLDALRSAMKM